MRDRDYNKELVKRGEMLIDLSLFESLTTPDAKPKRGRPYTYPKPLILLLLLLKILGPFQNLCKFYNTS